MVIEHRNDLYNAKNSNVATTTKKNTVIKSSIYRWVISLVIKTDIPAKSGMLICQFTKNNDLARNENIFVILITMSQNIELILGEIWRDILCPYQFIMGI